MAEPVHVTVQGTADRDVYDFTVIADSVTPQITGQITRKPKGLVITAMTITNTEITGHLFRRIRFGEILAAARTKIAPPTSSPVAPTEPRRPGRAPLTHELLRSVAEAYLRETAHGQPRGALRRMAAEFGRPEDTVNGWIKRARARGYLGPSVQGRAGAEPGPRLLVDA